MDSDQTGNNPEIETQPETLPESKEPSTAVKEPAPPQADEPQEDNVPYEIIEKISQEACVVHYKISVPRENLTKRIEEMLHELKGTVSIEGFRRGKAPRKLLEIRYGKEVKDDAVKSIAANVGEQIIKTEELKLVAEGDLHSWTAENENPLELVIEFEIAPKIDIQGYEGLEVEVEERPVTEEMVENRIQQLRESNAQYKAAGEGARFNPGDGITFDYEVLDEKGQRLEKLSSENIFERDPMNRLRKEISEKLIGMAAGETVEAQITQTHQTKQGQTRETTDLHRLALREIKIKELPNLDDEFAKDLGDFNTMDELRDRIRKDLNARSEEIVREESLAKIYDKLIELNAFDAPRTVVASATMSMARERLQQLAYAGIDMSRMGEEVQRHYVESTRTDAEKMVKTELLLSSLAEKEKLEVSDTDVEKAIEEIAEREGRRPLAVRARLERENRFEGLKSDLLSRKASDFLLSKASVKQVKPQPKVESAENS